MPKNVYIHIPFCKQKCKYCSFVSFPRLELKHKYLLALEDEIKHFYKNECLNTLYFGGGTPSLLTPDEFYRLINLFKTTDLTEITAELNPETVDKTYLEALYKTGVNRLSFGCQTFDDNTLKVIGRKHTSQQVKDVVKLAQQTGFDNVSLDFIYGLPNQTVESFEKDLQTALELGVQHISLYGLKIDEGCYFYNHMPENLPDLDMQADMYVKAIEILKDFGHYEISNFGRPSRHNLNYWDNNTYYGFGVAAHGYVDGVRYSNSETLEEYFANPLEHKFENKLTQQEKLEEEIFLGLRKVAGIDVENINKKFGIDFETKYREVLTRYRDYFVKTDRGYAFNTEGFLVSNNILAEFLA